MASCYSKEEIKNFLKWEEDIEVCKRLRRLSPPVMLHHTMNKQEYGYKKECKICGNKLYAKFGNFSLPLAEKYIPCANGGPNEGHGNWSSVINLVLN